MAFTATDIPDLTGKTALVTGATGGLGFETARLLARAGAVVLLAGRDPAKGAEALRTLWAGLPQAKACFEQIDLASLESIRLSAARLLRDGAPIDLLVNNAGLMAPPVRQTTQEGFERQFGVNHLGHFALTGRVLPLLLKAAKPRVVTVSSGVAAMGAIAFHDLQSERGYRPTAAYSQSKLANLLFMRGLARRSQARGWNLLSLAAHPGHARTDLIANGVGRPSGLTALLIKALQAVASQDAASGALPILMAATAANAQAMDFYAPSRMFQQKGPPQRVALPAPARGDQAAARLWTVSE